MITSGAVATAKFKLTDAGLAFPEWFQGCTEQEIQSLEDHFGVQLPWCYRDFLIAMGRSAGQFMVGTDYSFPKMFKFHEGAASLLSIWTVPGFVLPKNAFVFLSHQGYNYLWFLCRDREDDPPVYLFTESDKQPRIVSDSFSAWLLMAVDDDIAANRELNERRKG